MADQSIDTVYPLDLDALDADAARYLPVVPLISVMTPDRTAALTRLLDAVPEFLRIARAVRAYGEARAVEARLCSPRSSANYRERVDAETALRAARDELDDIAAALARGGMVTR